ncbi:MAG: OmpA family protein [Gammaproteobacteria bacterium]|nr:OmpA family protein [Gammaproteobacteria bacterium]
MLANSARGRRGALGLLLTGAVALGCQTNTGTVLDSKTTQGAILGTLAGAAAGAAIDDDKRGRGALIGAAVGGVAGGLIGNYMQKQAQEIDAIPDADVQRRDEGLLVMFPGDLLFDTGSAALSAGAYQRLRSLADTLKRYPDTNIVVKGHTDSTGDESYNLRLSEERADNVRRYLLGEGVAAHRVTAIGYGEAFPLATNATPEGRQQNRRVEIEIKANDELRERQAAGS